MDTKEYIEDLESALIDVLDGNSKWYEIKAQTGLSDERCKEIEHFFKNTVAVKYKKRHRI